MMEYAKKYVLVDPVMYSRTQVSASLPPPVKISRLDNEVRDILEGNEPDDAKAKHYAMALKKFRVRQPVRDEDDKVDETEIIESVPTTVRHKAKRMIRIVKESPHLAWNERGELIYNQTTIPGSSIVELFNDIFRQRRLGEDRPLGWHEFSEGLAVSKEISKELVSNYGSWKVINQNKPQLTSVVQAPATVTVDSEQRRRRSRAPERSTARKPARTLSWDEY